MKCANISLRKEMSKRMCYTIGTGRAAKLLGVSAPTVRGMIDRPGDMGFELGFRIPATKENPNRHNYRVYAQVLADKLGITLEEVIGHAVRS